jgi:hypothetical protein
MCQHFVTDKDGNKIQTCRRDARISCNSCQIAYCGPCNQEVHGRDGPNGRHYGMECMSRTSGFLSPELQKFVKENPTSIV